MTLRDRIFSARFAGFAHIDVGDRPERQPELALTKVISEVSPS